MWSALVGHCSFGGLAQWWLIPGFQMFFVSCVLVAMLDAAAKMVSMICVLCFRVLQGFRGNVKDKESGTWAVMWTNSLYSTIHQAMDGCGTQAAAALASALVIPTAAACSLTAAAFVRAITFVVDLLSAAASVQVIALVVDFWSAAALNEPGFLVFFFVLLLRICDVAITVRFVGCSWTSVHCGTRGRCYSACRCPHGCPFLRVFRRFLQKRLTW